MTLVTRPSANVVWRRNILIATTRNVFEWYGAVCVIGDDNCGPEAYGRHVDIIGISNDDQQQCVTWPKLLLAHTCGG